MVCMDVIIRCDHPGCTRSVKDSIPLFHPYFNNALAAGWLVPHDGDRYDSPCYCAEHKGLHSAVP